jgi:hypothetical protein
MSPLFNRFNAMYDAIPDFDGSRELQRIGKEMQKCSELHRLEKNRRGVHGGIFCLQF